MSGVSASAATARRAPLTSNSMVLVKVQSSQGHLRLLLLVRHTTTRSSDCKLALLGRRGSIMIPPYPDRCLESRWDKTARGLPTTEDTLDGCRQCGPGEGAGRPACRALP